ncbi:MAG TPA: aldehyde dehydrogenase family protein [Gemmatimonadales bacterium]|jgi:glyceraldehyde-3-phosphate dehydrogenase (NADP+)|nr:aldehyde dehydrogenase family protein [Gemmatimonadales bacterium]
MSRRVLTPYVNGDWVPRRRRAAEPVTAPFSGRTLAELVPGDAEDFAKAVAGARRAQHALARLSRHARGAILEQVSRLLHSERAELARLMAQDAGKPLALAAAEVDRAVTVFRLAAEEARRFGVSALPADADPRGDGMHALVERFPIGIIAAISPFNFPLNLVAHKVAPAIAAGNAVVLKPPPQAPLASFRLAELLTAAGLPPGGLQVLHLPIPLAERLATDPAFAMLSFTGSARVGWHLKSVAGRKRVLLELGGNAAVLIHSDAGNLAELAARIAWGAFAYSGQICIKVQRLYVHAPLFRRFCRLLVAATRRLPSGDPRRPDTVIGPLIDEAAIVRVQAWIAEAVAAGAKPLLRGRRRGSVLGATILSEVRPEMRVWREEVFGPVLTVTPYRGWQEAIGFANNSEYGLQAGVFTHDSRRITAAFRGLEVGGVVVNDIPTLRLDHLPYGGVKGSGFGREGVVSAMEAMSEPRLLLVRD